MERIESLCVGTRSVGPCPDSILRPYDINIALFSTFVLPSKSQVAVILMHERYIVQGTLRDNV